MASSLINIGISGLKAQQAALATTGHNITNASTQGYSRQVVQIEPHPPQYTGSAYIGRGATLETISRVASDFATGQVRLDTAAFAGLDTFVNQISQVDSLLADEQTGLAPALQTFFGALQSASSDPGSIPTRQVVLSDAGGLAIRFNTMYQRLNSQQQGLDQQLVTTTDEINELALGIGRLNDRIAGADGRSSGVLPNDLLDQREELLRKLAEKIDVRVVTQNDGQTSVFVGKGQPLITGSQVGALQAVGNGQITLSSSKTAPGQNITGSISGGQLGGLLDFRNGVLDSALNQLGRIAIGLADAINQQQRKGVTLSGEFGDNLFTDINSPTVMAQRAIALDTAPGYPAGTLAVAIDSPAQLTTSGYEVRFDRAGNGAFTLVRLSDGRVVGDGSVGQGLPTRVSADGFTVTIQSGDFHGGDRYLIEPTRSGAHDITNVIANGADLAFSSPVRADSSYGNQGSGVATAGAVFDAASPSFAVKGTLSPPLLIRFTSETTYEILDNSDPSAPRSLQPPLRNLPYVPGIGNSLLPGEPGQTRVASTGGNVQRLVTAAVPTLGLLTGSNGYLAQQIRVANTDASGFVQSTQTFDASAGSSARVIAAGLSQLDGVSASAQTNLSIVGINTNAAGVPMALVINGQRFSGADLASLNTLADAIGRNSSLVAAGISARSNGSRLELTSAVGDNLDVSISGDAADAVDLAGPGGGSVTLRGAGLGTPAQLTGNVDRSAGFDFSSGGPYSFGLAIDGGAPAVVTLSGTYPSGAALVAALQGAIDASTIGAGRALVSIDGAGHIQIASLASGANGSVAVTGAANGSPIATALGIGNAAVSGVDLYRNATVGGSVSVLLDANRQLSTDATTINTGIFTATPAAVRADFGYQVTMSGRPRSGDSFAIGYNDGAVSDNANVLAMADVQTRKLFGKDGSLFDAYANIVESVGARTSQARIDRDASNGLLQQSVAQRDSISGVNLDEEAANLIRFQQAYNASARVIAVARDTFDTLFRMIG